MLDCYTFEGEVEFKTFTGPEKYPVEFTLMVSPDADPFLHNMAGKAICQFLIHQHYIFGSDTLEFNE